MKISGCKSNLIKGNEQGFLIVEGLIALAIFGIVMAGIVYMMTGTIRANALAGKITEATTLAADTIEQIASMDYNNNWLQNNSYPQVTRSDIGSTTYTTVVTTAFANVAVPNTMNIQVEVRWTDPAGRLLANGTRARSVVLKDIKTQVF